MGMPSRALSSGVGLLALGGLVSCCAGAYLAAPRVLGPVAAATVTDGVLVLSMLVPAALTHRYAVRLPPAARRPWRLAAASGVASAAVFGGWLAYHARGAVVPVPAPTDLPYLLAVGLMVLAVLHLPRVALRRPERLGLALDGAVVATSLLLLSWRLTLGATVDDVTGLAPGAVVLIAYPLADVVAVSVALIVASRSASRDRGPVLLIAAGVMALAVGDTAYGYLSLTGSWQTGHPAGVAWLLGYPLVALGAIAAAGPRALAAAGTDTHVRPDPGPSDDEPAVTRLRVVLLLGPVLPALLLTATGPMTPVAAAAMAVLVTLVVARLGAALSGEQRLRATLQAQVTEQTRTLQRQAERLIRQVYVDPVTQLGNRTLLRHRAEGAPLDGAALLLLDLDGFKEVNDTLGHAAGDAVLVEIGTRLQGLVRPVDTVVRLGGDEFALLLEGVTCEHAQVVADRVLAAARDAVAVPTAVSQSVAEVRVAASVGLALGDTSTDVDELLRQADLAMYEAKAAGGDLVRRFDPAMNERLRERILLDAEVRTAVEQGQLTVYYQPIVCARSGEVCGMEALVRWDHPQRGVIVPYEFLAAAERTGVVVDLGRFVLRTACRHLSGWRADWPDLTVAVNLSQQELLDPGLEAVVREVLQDNGLPPSALHLEVTETVLLADADIAWSLRSLSGLGVSVSIDDFGTGHSSLARLRELPVQRLKIDRSFTAEIEDGSAPLLASIIALAHSLEREVVVEGVETAEQLDFLVLAGCDELQGYLFSRPVPAEHVVALLIGTRLPAADDTSATPSRLPSLMAALASGGEAVDAADLVRELATTSGLDSVFLTTISGGQQVTWVVYDTGALTIPEGQRVDWGDTLCGQLAADGLTTCSAVGLAYPGNRAAARLGIETFVSLPIRGDDGEVVGTLCGACADRREVPAPVLGLMALFADALSGQLTSLTSMADEAS